MGKKPHSIVYDNELLILQAAATRLTCTRAMNHAFPLIYFTICAKTVTVLYKKDYVMSIILIFFKK